MLQEDKPHFPAAQTWAELRNPTAKPKKSKPKVPPTPPPAPRPTASSTGPARIAIRRAGRWFIRYSADVTHGALVKVGIAVVLAVAAGIAGYNYDPELFDFHLKQTEPAQNLTWTPVVVVEPHTE